MGRRKIEIKYIADDRNRSVTFIKRKNGLFKKAHELSILTGAKVTVHVEDIKDRQFDYKSANHGDGGTALPQDMSDDSGDEDDEEAIFATAASSGELNNTSGSDGRGSHPPPGAHTPNSLLPGTPTAASMNKAVGPGGMLTPGAMKTMQAPQLPAGGAARRPEKPPHKRSTSSAQLGASPQQPVLARRSTGYPYGIRSPNPQATTYVQGRPASMDMGMAYAQGLPPPPPIGGWREPVVSVPNPGPRQGDLVRMQMHQQQVLQQQQQHAAAMAAMQGQSSAANSPYIKIEDATGSAFSTPPPGPGIPRFNSSGNLQALVNGQMQHQIYTGPPSVHSRHPSSQGGTVGMGAPSSAGLDPAYECMDDMEDSRTQPSTPGNYDFSTAVSQNPSLTHIPLDYDLTAALTSLGAQAYTSPGTAGAPDGGDGDIAMVLSSTDPLGLDFATNDMAADSNRPYLPPSPYSVQQSPSGYTGASGFPRQGMGMASNGGPGQVHPSAAARQAFYYSASGAVSTPNLSWAAANGAPPYHGAGGGDPYGSGAMTGPGPSPGTRQGPFGPNQISPSRR